MKENAKEEMGMKKLFLMLLCGGILAGCSSGGVSQEEYESVVAERDEYKAALESIASLFGTEAEVAETDGGEDQTNSNEPQKLNLLDSGWTSYKSGDWAHVKYAVQIENPNTEYAIEFPEIIITARDAEGKILSTDERTLNSIAADDTIYYGDEIFYEGGEPASVEISVSNKDRNLEKQDDAKYVKQSDFVISNTSENIGSYDVKYTGEITNNSNADFDSVAVVIIYKQGDSIIGGDIEYVDDLMAGSTKAFELSADSDEFRHDSYEFFAIQW